MKTRILLFFTEEYAIKPFKIVYDSSKSKKRMEDVYWRYNKKGKDNEFKLLRASTKITNQQILKVINKTTELSTPKSTILNEIDFLNRATLREIVKNQNNKNYNLKAQLKKHHKHLKKLYKELKSK